MAKKPPSTELTPEIYLKDGVPFTDSRIVAKQFGKRHSDVLRAIENLDCSEVFRERNFALSQNETKMPTGGTRTYKFYEMTKDGFTMLAMGFTGPKAMAWKEAYITAFNMLVEQVATPALGVDASQLAIEDRAGELAGYDAPRLPGLAVDQIKELETLIRETAERCGQPKRVVRGRLCVHYNARHLSSIPQARFSSAIIFLKNLTAKSRFFGEPEMFTFTQNDVLDKALDAWEDMGHWIRRLADEAEEGREAREKLETILQALKGKGGAE